jgi:hypothetical protein
MHTHEPETPGHVDEPTQPSRKPISEKRLAANRANAEKSTGPRTATGKQRSALNATRHGILAQVIHLPEEEMKAYDRFTGEYVATIAPVGAIEIQLANACADLQFRLHRLSAAEHNLFAIGHEENGNEWNSGHPESHTALTLAETLRRSKDPLSTITLYEQRLSRRFLQTLKQLRDMQAERRQLEQQQLEQMYAVAEQHPSQAESMEPADFGFVCSNRDWKLYHKRRLLVSIHEKGATRYIPPSFNARELLKKVA